MLAGLLGGVGLFLLGMILLTEGLRAAAGDALRGILSRFTGTPLASVASGAGVSAVVQSSSATTLTTIGFVSAGLLTFPQAVGVIFGSNLGTTSTGWIVSLLGLKLQVGQIAFPLIGVGAFLRLLSHGRRAQLGLALAGFGLIFVGIDALQVGMTSLAERVDPSSFPDPTFLGAAGLVAVGAVMTVLMQSSSAAVATTLTALHAGTVGMEQAAFLVIGQNMGTTVKAGLAALGASVPARRTALAHILFNVVTGGIALLLLPVLLPLLGRLLGAGDPAVIVAAFHSTFNLLGVLVLFPFLTPFCRIVERAVPERGPVLTRHLDRSVAEIPAVAVEAARRSVMETGEVVLEVARERMGSARAASAPVDPRLEAARTALEEVRKFLSSIRTPPELASEYQRHLGVLHASDHLDRLLDALETAADPLLERDEGEDALVGAPVMEALGIGLAALREGNVDPGPIERVNRIAQEVADLRRTRRARLLEAIAAGERSPQEAFGGVEWMRWVDRVGYHTWRALHHLLASSGRPTAVTDSGFDSGDPEDFGGRPGRIVENDQPAAAVSSEGAEAESGENPSV